jgi:hypothetical protein
MNASMFLKPAALSQGWDNTETFRLSKRSSLILILTVSLGLWAGIWAAVASLASLAMG